MPQASAAVKFLDYQTSASSLFEGPGRMLSRSILATRLFGDESLAFFLKGDSMLKCQMTSESFSLFKTRALYKG